MLKSLFSTPWKLATIGAGILSLVLVSLLMASGFENRDLTRQRTELANRINDPKTGFVVRLAQAQTNVETLKVALETQRASFKKESDKQNLALRASEQRLATAQRETRAMEVKLQRFLATKPQGDTLEDRVRDIDERAMTELVE